MINSPKNRIWAVTGCYDFSNSLQAHQRLYIDFKTVELSAENSTAERQTYCSLSAFRFCTSFRKLQNIITIFYAVVTRPPSTRAPLPCRWVTGMDFCRRVTERRILRLPALVFTLYANVPFYFKWNVNHFRKYFGS